MARQHTVLLQPFSPQGIVRRSFRIFVTRLRETHRPESIEFGHASPKFAVDKVADTAGSQAQRYERRNGIHQLQDTDVVLAAKQPHGNDHAQEAAVKRHTAFPNFENIQRVGKIIGKFIKQNVADTAAQDHAQDTPSQEIVECFFGKHRITLRDTAAAQNRKQDKADNIAQGIPTDGKRADADQHRIKLGMYHHNVCSLSQRPSESLNFQTACMRCRMV